MGVWKSSSYCYDVQDVNASNAGCTATWELSPDVTGSITINSDLFYNWSFTGGVGAITTFSAACLATSGSDTACTSMGQTLVPAVPGGEMDPVFCAFVDQKCQCEGGAWYPPSTESGQLTVQGGVMSFASSTGGVTQVSYCVKGDELSTSLITLAPDGGLMNTSTTHFLNFKKQ